MTHWNADERCFPHFEVNVFVGVGGGGVDGGGAVVVVVVVVVAAAAAVVVVDVAVAVVGVVAWPTLSFVVGRPIVAVVVFDGVQNDSVAGVGGSGAVAFVSVFFGCVLVKKQPLLALLLVWLEGGGEGGALEVSSERQLVATKRKKKIEKTHW